MSELFFDEANALDDFEGDIRLFPLPNLVLFPHVLQPLHIFEPRYRAMTAESLETDRLIAMVLLRPGWDVDQSDRPDIHPMTCLARIVKDQCLPDGRYILLMQGLVRAKIVCEKRVAKPFRVAQVVACSDDCAGIEDSVLLEFRSELMRALELLFPPPNKVHAHFDKLTKTSLNLGTLIDIVSYCLELEIETKQSLLKEVSLVARIDHLLKGIRKMAKAPHNVPLPSHRYPVHFSDN